MPQSFHVLRCSSCQTFQVQQVKKSNKWICKLCGEKQSLMKVYGQGSGVDCRCHVKKLNMMRGEIELAAEMMAGSIEMPEEVPDDNVSQKETLSLQEEKNLSNSRWAKYTEQCDGELCQEEEDDGEGSAYTTDRQQFYSDRKNASRAHRKRKQSWQPDCDRGAKQCLSGDRLEKTAGLSEAWNSSSVGPRQLQCEAECEQPSGKLPKPRQILQDVQPCKQPCMSTSKWGQCVFPSINVEGCSEKMLFEQETQGASKPSPTSLQDGLEGSCNKSATLFGACFGWSTKGTNSRLHTRSLHAETPTTLKITSSSEMHLRQDLLPEHQTWPAPNGAMQVPPKPTLGRPQCFSALGLSSPVRQPFIVSTAPGRLFQTDDDFDDDI